MYFRKYAKLIMVVGLAFLIMLGHNNSVSAKTVTSTKKTYYSNKKVKYKYVFVKKNKVTTEYKRYTYSKSGKLTNRKIVRYKSGKRYLTTYYRYKGKKAIKTSRVYYYNTFSKKIKATSGAFAKRTYKSNGKTTKKLKYYSKTGKRSAVAAKAKTLVGKKYRYGGTTTKGFDCSGLTSYVYNKTVSKSIGRTTGSQTKKGSYVKLSTKKLQPGDLLFWGSKSSPYHVGVYIGSGKYVHASTPKSGVIVNKLSTYKPAYAKRVI
ncbi:C40 family peptidase [Mycoplasma sp. P36-A1]|uniref:C40 family peptidase n=1 Tax=Mycoplasma sp. P36-A1 TaxID=3252900 RepID=UPI003C2B3348